MGEIDDVLCLANEVEEIDIEDDEDRPLPWRERKFRLTDRVRIVGKRDEYYVAGYTGRWLWLEHDAPPRNPPITVLAETVEVLEMADERCATVK
jgi:hypothetical protein